MKKLIIISIAIVLTAGACNLSRLNQNIKQPTPASAGANAAGPLYLNAEYQFGRFIHRTNVNIEIFKLWSQQWTTTTYTEEPDYNITDRGIPGNDWNILYHNVLESLSKAESILRSQNPSTASAKTVKKNKIASINIMKVLAYSKLVDIFGYAPYTKALNSKYPNPPYDSGKSIYNALIDSLNTAINNIDTNASGFDDSQTYYGGDMKKIMMFANSLKMRLGITIADAEPSKAKKAVTSASPHAFHSNADNAMIPFTSTPPHTNPVWIALVQSGRHDYLPSSAFMDRLNARNDPRRSIWFTKINGKYKGGKYGFKNTYGDFSHASDLVTKKDRPGMIMSYSEVEFIRAEADARGWNVGGSAASHYKEAIKANMERWGISMSKFNNYYNQKSVDYTTASGNWKQKIGLQKWFALYLQGLQAWTEVRRLDYPQLKAPNNGKAITIGQLPSRFTYPVAEQTENQDHYNKAAKAMGGDKLTTHIFWDTMGTY